MAEGFEAAQARAARWLAAWDAQGTHRTATAGDAAGAAWLADEAAALGAHGSTPVTFEDYALDRLDPVAAYLEIGGRRIDAMPLFDAPATDPAGVSGRLGPVDSDADIAVAELSPLAGSNGELKKLRDRGGHRGLVVICTGDNPGLALLNAESFRRPYGVPTIQLSGEAGDAVREAADSRAPARLVAESRRTPATGRNIVIALTGTEPASPPLVVMTPRSSWWQSTAERGGGIVCWLESLRALFAAPPNRPVAFTANSGHELGHLGFDAFLARRPGWQNAADQGGATWMHFGANIGAAEGELFVVSAADDLRALADTELGLAGQSYRAADKKRVPTGETRDIHLAGGRCIALVGKNPLFHLPQDRWPHAVDVTAVARTAAAAARMVVALSRAGAPPATDQNT